MPHDASPLPSEWLAFLMSRGARLGNGRVADFGDAAAELAAARDATVLADLSHNALLEVTGDDATAFLHGQFTNDVQALKVGSAQWNAWCSAKGRMLASFLLLRREDGYLLLLPAEIAPAVAKRLRMFVLRSKVKIEDVSAQWARVGFAGKSARVLVGNHWHHAPEPMRWVERDGAVCVALDDERFAILASPAAAQPVFDKLAANAAKAGADAWDWSLIQAGIPMVVAATQDAFVPQMANYELLGGVSFKKGCYPGQEIVARTQYRGILKRRMALAHVGGTARPQPGDKVYSTAFGDQAAGEVANAAPSPEGGFDALVVAQLESLDRRDLRLASLQGEPLDIRSRPGVPA